VLHRPIRHRITHVPRLAHLGAQPERVAAGTVDWPMYRSLLRPKWIAFHLLVALLVVVMVNLGLWQLRRLDQRQERNEIVREHSELAVEPVTDWLSPASDRDAVAAAEWRPLAAEGVYDDAATVLIRNRTLDGAAGYHVVTPLVLDGREAVLVNRGFIPRGASADAPDPPAAPTGQVSIVGRVRPTQERGLFGPLDPDEGTLTQAQRIDVPRLAEQLPYAVLPAYLELQTTAPAPPEPQPSLLPLPALDEGPHLSYALQWFFFSALALAGWFVAVHREVVAARRRDPDAPQALTPVP
jgi:cytochrome oxidase assembly protein ShyY1